MEPLFIASQNAHKVEEFRHLLRALPLHVMSLPDGVEDAPESATTFEANAMEKAVYYGTRCNALVLADDSGLCVDALNGRPGVHSARYAGRHGEDAANNTKLLSELVDIPDGQRAAQFVCALAFWNPHQERGLVVRGTMAGVISKALKGTNGFGYDPLFYLPSLARTYAELDITEKSKLSHRARAVDAWIACLGGQADEIVFGQ